MVPGMFHGVPIEAHLGLDQKQIVESSGIDVITSRD